MLEKEVFRPLKDITVFRDICRVMNDTPAWDMGSQGPGAYDSGTFCFKAHYSDCLRVGS